MSLQSPAPSRRPIRAGRVRRGLTAVLVALAATLSLTGLTGLTASPASAAASPTPVASARVDGRVLASVVVGSRVVLGGSFSSVTNTNGTTVARHNMAAFDLATGALVTTFRADTDAEVRALATDGSRVWLGGNFQTVNGVARKRIAAVNASTGAVATGFTSAANAGVSALDLRGGKLFVGGTFTGLGGKARTYAGALNPTTGALDAGFAPVLDAKVRALRATSTGAQVYLGGDFTTVGTAARQGLARVSGTTGAVAAPVFAQSPKIVLAVDLSPDGTRLYAGGGGGNNAAAAWATSTGRRLWNITTQGDVQAVRQVGSQLYLGFHDGFGGNDSLRLLRADAVTGARDTTFAPVFTGFFGVFTIASTATRLVVGGEFTQISGVNAGGWARFPG